MSWGITEKQSNEIVNFITENHYCGIIAPTGSGKSTRMIRSIHELTGASIFITQPTIPAAKNLYQEMTRQMGPGKIGYAAEGEANYNRFTPIVYCTAGHLRRKMLSYFENGIVKSGAIDFCQVIVLDEAHNGSIDNDVITELWIQAAVSGIEVPRLVLASATLDKDSTVFKELPVYAIPTKSKEIKLEYAPKDYKPDANILYQDLAIEIIKKHINNPVPENDVSKWLVFCAGSREVEDVCSLLREPEFDNMIIFPIYSGLPEQDRAKIGANIELGKRAVFVATNIVEASLTIDGLDGVFDSLTEKVAETSSSGGLRLVVKHISKSSAKQRMGRTGRTREGFCYRMCTEKFFKTLPEQREPEIARAPITNVAIEFINVGLDPVKLFKGRVSEIRMKDTLNLLKNLKMIDSKNMVTDLGKFVTMFPLGVRNSALIYNWIQLKKKDGSPYPIYPIVVLACLIDCYSPWYYFIPKKDEDMNIQEYGKFKSKYFREYFSKYESNNDLKTMLRMWNYTLNTFKSLKPEHEELLAWSQENSLNNKKMKELFKVVKKCCEDISKIYGVVVQIGPFDEDTVLRVAKPLLINSYGDNTFELAKDGVYFSRKNKTYYKLDNQAKLNPGYKELPNKILALSTREIVTSSGFSSNIISLSFPI
jgi:HrpA-like RNA helicase